MAACAASECRCARSPRSTKRHGSPTSCAACRSACRSRRRRRRRIDGRHGRPRRRGAAPRCCRHRDNRGKGTAIRTGLAPILPRDFTHVLFLDGDMQHDPADAPALIEAARRGAATSCSASARSIARRCRGRATTRTRSAAGSSRASSSDSGVADAQSGYRLIATDLLRRLRLSGRGYEIETEMLIKLARRGARIARVPIGLRYHGAASKLRPLRDTTRTCFLAVRYRFFPERFQ